MQDASLKHRPPKPAWVLLAGVALLFVVQSLVGITWGLPSKRIDRFLFSGEVPWSGEKIARLAGTAGRFSAETGADVDVDPIERAAGEPLLVNGNDEDIAKIYVRYRLFTHQPDEMITMMSLAGMSPSQWRFDPRLYQYGGLFIYSVGALIRCAGAVGLIDVRSDEVFYLDNPDEFAKFYIVARAYSAAWGLIGVFIVYGIARRLSDWRGGVLAALLFSVMPVVVCMSHEGKPHLPGAVLMLAAVYFAMRHLGAPPLSAAEGWGTEDAGERTKNRSLTVTALMGTEDAGEGEKNRSLTVTALLGLRAWWWLMCVCCGAALGMVLSSAPIFVLIPLVAWLGWRGRPGERETGRRTLDVLLGLVLATLVYLVTNPYIVINALTNRDVLASNFGNSLAMYEVSRIGEGFGRVLELTREGATLPIVVLGAIALIAAIARKKSAITPLAVVAAILFAQFVLIGAGKPAEYGRFGVFTNTALAIAAACLMGAKRPNQSPLIRWLGIPLLSAWVMFGGSCYVLHFAKDCGDQGSRLRTARFIQGELTDMRPNHDEPLEVALFAEPAPYYCPPLDFRKLDVRLYQDWDEEFFEGWDPDSNRVILRPVDVSPVISSVALEGNRFDTPISWAHKPFEIEAKWKEDR